MHLEIGGGTLTPDAEVNLDPVHGTPGWQFYAQDMRWPAEDNTFSSARASHVLEHIPSGQARIHVMNEAHRVLQPGGVLEVVIPLVGHTDGAGGHITQGWWPWSDPTHVSFWWFPESLLYFCEGPFKPNADYGISIWQELRDEDWEVVGGWEGHAKLRKP